MNKCKLLFQKYLSLLFKYIFLFWFGGSTYVTLEVMWRGYSHWTMFVLAGAVFIFIGLLNEIWEWGSSFVLQCIIGTIVATIAELFTGIIVNLWLGWNVWDYSNLPGNFIGQICPQFTIVWLFISIIAIVVDDVIRWKFFGEEKPHYKI